METDFLLRISAANKKTCARMKSAPSATRFHHISLSMAGPTKAPLGGIHHTRPRLRLSVPGPVIALILRLSLRDAVLERDRQRDDVHAGLLKVQDET